MSARAGHALRHDALLYASEGEFVGALEPFVRDGLEAGEPVVAVTTPRNTAALREALGEAASAVGFVDAARWYRHPAQTLAAYHGVVEEQRAAGAARVRVIGEVRYGDTPEAQRRWMRYEAALNHTFERAPAWIVCPYDERSLPDHALRHAARSHPHLVRGRRRYASPGYAGAAALLSELAASAPELGELEADGFVEELDVDGDLGAARRSLRRLAARHGVRPDRLDDLTMAANEVLTNALVHGRPPVRLRIAARASAVVCEVSDTGAGFTDPLAGYTPPSADEPRADGMGLWLARQLCDEVVLVPARNRTIVRLVVTLD